MLALSRCHMTLTLCDAFDRLVTVTLKHMTGLHTMCLGGYAHPLSLLSQATDRRIRSPGLLSGSPDRLSRSPDQLNESSDRLSESSDRLNESPDRLNESSDQVSESPDRLNESPDRVRKSLTDSDQQPQLTDLTNWVDSASDDGDRLLGRLLTGQYSQLLRMILVTRTNPRRQQRHRRWKKSHPLFPTL